MNQYVHRYDKRDGLWSVGYWTTEVVGGEDVQTRFRVLEEFGSSSAAAAFLNYLNGGEGKPFPYEE